MSLWTHICLLLFLHQSLITLSLRVLWLISVWFSVWKASSYSSYWLWLISHFRVLLHADNIHNRRDRNVPCICVLFRSMICVWCWECLRCSLFSCFARLSKCCFCFSNLKKMESFWSLLIPPTLRPSIIPVILQTSYRSSDRKTVQWRNKISVYLIFLVKMLFYFLPFPVARICDGS